MCAHLQRVRQRDDVYVVRLLAHGLYVPPAKHLHLQGDAATRMPLAADMLMCAHCTWCCDNNTVADATDNLVTRKQYAVCQLVLVDS